MKVGDYVEAKSVLGYVSQPTKYTAKKAVMCILRCEKRTAGESGGVYGGSGLTERDRRFLRNFPVFFSVLPISKYAEKSMNR